MNRFFAVHLPPKGSDSILSHRMAAFGAQAPILHGRGNGRVCPYSPHSLARPDRLDMAPRVGVLSFPLTWLEGQRQFGDATGDVETPVTFHAERLQRD
jgi:hypothetical protein